MIEYNPNTKEYEVILTKEQARSLANEIEEYLVWFQDIALPLYNKLFGEE